MRTNPDLLVIRRVTSWQDRARPILPIFRYADGLFYADCENAIRVSQNQHRTSRGIIAGAALCALCRYRHKCHVWQQTHGTPPRRSYHDQEWVAKMREIDLQSSTTGEPGGKKTGQSVTHSLVSGGPFARAYAKLAAAANAGAPSFKYLHPK